MSIVVYLDREEGSSTTGLVGSPNLSLCSEDWRVVFTMLDSAKIRNAPRDSGKVSREHVHSEPNQEQLA